MMSEQVKEPKGTLITRLFPTPADTNIYGAVFGGWMMSQMDVAGFLLARDYTEARLVTIAVNNVTFLAPIFVGDLVSIHGEVIKQGRSSIQVQLKAWVKRDKVMEFQCVAEGLVTYVAVNEKGESIPLR